mgnify:FL=1
MDHSAAGTLKNKEVLIMKKLTKEMASIAVNHLTHGKKVTELLFGFFCPEAVSDIDQGWTREESINEFIDFCYKLQEYMKNEQAMDMLARYSYFGLSYALACVDHAGEEWATTHLPPRNLVLNRLENGMKQILQVNANASSAEAEKMSEDEVSEIQAWIQAVKNIRTGLE